MKSMVSTHILIFLALCFTLFSSCTAETFDFYYFIQQWPGSHCNAKQGCCYPKTGKPASDFIVYGLQPYSNLGSPLLNCDPNSHFDSSKISKLTTSLQRYWPTLACPQRDGLKHWSSEWTTYGTCSRSVLDQATYFEAALNLKTRVNLLQILKTAGIQPNGKSYNLDEISEAIRKVMGHEPGIQCNEDKSGNTQIDLIYLCANTQGSRIIECPGIPMGTCKTSITFPSF